MAIEKDLLDQLLGTSIFRRFPLFGAGSGGLKRSWSGLAG